MNPRKSAKTNLYSWIFTSKPRLYSRDKLYRHRQPTVVTKTNQNSEKINLLSARVKFGWLHLKKRRFKLTECFALIGWPSACPPPIGRNALYYGCCALRPPEAPLSIKRPFSRYCRGCVTLFLLFFVCCEGFRDF